MSLQSKRYFVKRITRLGAGTLALVIGLSYFFPEALSKDKLLIRGILLGGILLISLFGWAYDKRLVNQDKKRKRDSLPMN